MLAVSFLSLGFRAGAVVAFSIPIVLAVVFTVMYATGIDFQRVSLGALIISLGLLVDDAMITTETMVSRLEAGDNKTSAATYAYRTTAFPMLTGTLVTICGFVPIGFAQSDAGEYTFSLFAVVSIALITSWFVAVLFAPLFGVAVLSYQWENALGQAEPREHNLSHDPRSRHALALVHNRKHDCSVWHLDLWSAIRSTTILSPL